MAANKKKQFATKLDEIVSTHPECKAVLEKLATNLKDPSMLISKLVLTPDHFEIELSYVEKKNTDAPTE